MKNTLSLADMLDATDLDDAAKANVIAACVIGSKTDPFAPGSAASIIPAMIHYHTPDTYGVYVGNLTNVYNALKQCALAYGVTFIEDRAIKTVLSGESAIEGVVLDNDEEINADYYILDHDPVWFFCDYLTDFSVSPAFRNRIAPDKNLKHTQRVRVVLSELPKGINVRHSLVAPSVDYIKNAYIDTKTDGGPQNPVLSVVSYESSDQGIVLDILAHPFDPHLKEGNATVQAVTDSVKNGLKQIDPDIEEKITATEILSCPTLCGQPNFTGTMPLLQLLKVFFGHHSLAYDMPITNMIMAGYGAHTVSHSHVVNGGIRAANLYESLSEDGKK